MGGPTNGGRSRAFNALRESEALHRALLSNISDAVFLTDDAGQFTYVCPNVDVIFGYGPDEVLAMSTIDGLLGDTLFAPADLAARGEILNLEQDVVSKSGARRTVLVNVKRVDIMGGTVLFACRDVTDRKRVEEQAQAARVALAHTSRLALVGQLVTSVTNELNQPLTSIAANAGAGLRRLDNRHVRPGEGLEFRDLLEDIRRQSHSAAGIVARLQVLAHPRAFEMESLDVGDALRDVLRLFADEVRQRGIVLRLKPAAGALRVRADRVFLQQALSNLIMNAIEAVEQLDGDRIVTARTRRRRDDVEILISDSGRGIAAEHASRLFDTSFTTKEQRLGLGLSIARSLVEAQNGRLSVLKSGGPGTTFCVALRQMPT